MHSPGGVGGLAHQGCASGPATPILAPDPIQKPPPETPCGDPPTGTPRPAPGGPARPRPRQEAPGPGPRGRGQPGPPGRPGAPRARPGRPRGGRSGTGRSGPRGGPPRARTRGPARTLRAGCPRPAGGQPPPPKIGPFLLHLDAKKAPKPPLRTPPQDPPKWAPQDPPKWAPSGPPQNGGLGTPKNAHFFGYLITLPVGTDFGTEFLGQNSGSPGSGPAGRARTGFTPASQAPPGPRTAPVPAPGPAPTPMARR